MRLTVGPLPPAVYWRRRAVVLGALLAVIIVLYSACGGSDSGAGRRNNAASPSAGPSATGSPEPTGSLLGSETADPDAEDETGTGTGDGGTGTGDGEAGDEDAAGEPAPAPQAPAAGPCTDEEMAIRPVPAKNTVTRGTPIDIRLLIENTSTRSCSRDVGADLQELRLVLGAQTIWSSDQCGPSRGSDVRTFAPGAEREYMVTWNGNASSKCSGGVPSGAPPEAGDYQLLARLGTKRSAPVVLTVVRPAA
jgi:hypothetical protein